MKFAVIYDKDEKPYSIRYDAIYIAMLNEFIKHKVDYEKLKNDFERLQESHNSLKNFIDSINNPGGFLS